MVKGDDGVKFENLTALCLLKHVYGINDFKGLSYTLNYLRTKDGAEVDFCIVNGNEPELMIEVKRSNPEPGKALVNFNKRYNIPGIQLVLHLKREKRDRNIDVRRGLDYLGSLVI